MIKYVCDCCGKELPKITMWDITIDSLSTDTSFRFNVCSECTLAIKRTFLNADMRGKDNE